MTKNELNRLSGIALDQAIATRIMGWKLIETHPQEIEKITRGMKYTGINKHLWVGPDGRWDYVVPQFSSKDKEIWEVVRHMEATYGFQPKNNINQFMLMNNGNQEESWLCEFTYPAWASGSTYGVAICRAALAAVIDANEGFEPETVKEEFNGIL